MKQEKVKELYDSVEKLVIEFENGDDDTKATMDLMVARLTLSIKNWRMAKLLKGWKENESI